MSFRRLKGNLYINSRKTFTVVIAEHELRDVIKHVLNSEDGIGYICLEFSGDCISRINIKKAPDE